MKKLLFPLLFLLSFAASAQLPGATKINSRYEWLAGKFLQLKLPIYADTSQYPLWIPRLAGDVMLDTAGTDAGTVYVRYGQPPYWQAIKGDTTGSGGGGSDSASTYIAQGLGMLIDMTGDTLTLTAPSGTFSLRDGRVTTEAKWDSLISAIGTSRFATIMVDTIIPITASKSVPANVQLFFNPAGRFNISSTRTLTISGPFTANRFQIFEGLGNAVLGVNSTSFVFPEWYGARSHLSGDGVDDQAGIMKAFTGGTNIKNMVLASGIYETDGPIAVPQGWRLVGSQWQATTIRAKEAMTSVLTVTSRGYVANMRVHGGLLANIGMDILSGNRCQIENIEFLNFLEYGMRVGVMNNSTFSNNTFQYAGKAQLFLNGALNCTFIGNNGNSDEFIVGDSTTRGILVSDSRNCRFIGGIWERSNNKYQAEVRFSEDLHFQDMEMNNGEVGLYVAGGTVTADHVEFTNPKYRAMYAAAGGTINVINNGTAMVGGSNARPMSFLNGGNIKYNAASAYPLWSYSLRGGSAGSALSAATLAYDSLKQNFTVTTTASLASGWSLGFGSSIYNTPVGTGLNFRTHIKNISTSQPLIAYIELAAGGRRFMGILTPGMNSVHYTARGDERYRVDIGASTAAITSFNPSLAELWITAGDSTPNSDTAIKYDVVQYATSLSDSTPATIFNTKQFKEYFALYGPGGGTTPVDTTNSEYVSRTNNRDLYNKTITEATFKSGLTGLQNSNLSIHNLSTIVTNYERGRIYWSGNVLNFRTELAGTGVERGMTFGTGSKNQIVFGSGTTGFIRLNGFSSTAGGQIFTAVEGQPQGTGGLQTVLKINPTVTQSSGAGFDIVSIMPSILGAGSGGKSLFKIGTASSGTEVTKVLVDTSGSIFIPYTTVNSASGSDSVLVKNASTGRIELKSQASFSGGGGTPGGSSGQLQYNNAGAFGGFGSWDGNALGITPGTNGQATFRINNAAGSGMFQFGTYPSVSTLATLWMAGVTPSTSNFVIANDNANTIVNGLTSVSLSSSGAAAKFLLNSSGVSLPALTGAGTDMMTITAAGLIGRATIPSGVAAAGNNNTIQFNRNGSFTGVDSLTWFAGNLYTYGSFGSLKFALATYGGHLYTDPTSGVMTASGGSYFNYRSATTTTTTDNDEVISVSASGGSNTITLGTPGSIAGLYPRLTIRKSDASVNTVTIAGTINGVTNKVLHNPDHTVTLQWNGTDWTIISETGATAKWSITGASTVTPVVSGNVNYYDVTALSVAATIAAPTGTVSNHTQLILRIKDNGTARALTWNAIYRAGTDIALPTTTTISKTMYLTFDYNSADSKYDFVGYTKGF